MNDSTVNLDIRQEGTTTAIGFGALETLDHTDFSRLEKDLTAAIEERDFDLLLIELTGLKRVCSGLFAYLAAMVNRGIQVQLRNPTGHVREMLRTTKLDQLMEVVETQA